ncbi:MAG: hypothetical protein KGZ71_00220 [Desulfobulbaceae bacterium]|nr:hypothetical protein [Candidatus Kapabacteria bacterium]MBS3998884.1 hypothetical protein [Desulfobulbaceae bacterium]
MKNLIIFLMAIVSVNCQNIEPSQVQINIKIHNPLMNSWALSFDSSVNSY